MIKLKQIYILKRFFFYKSFIKKKTKKTLKNIDKKKFNRKINKKILKFHKKLKVSKNPKEKSDKEHNDLKEKSDKELKELKGDKELNDLKEKSDKELKELKSDKELKGDKELKELKSDKELKGDKEHNDLKEKSDKELKELKGDKEHNDYQKYIVKFCVFLGREKNIRVLHSYVELGLKNNTFNEYHMYDFSRIIEDHLFIKEEYTRLNLRYPNRIFLHNYEENKNIPTIKTDWSPFYKNISKCDCNDIIIKCDDDILFIDIFALKNAINDRINDKVSFLIHSNCINNGVCTYYQKDIYSKLKENLNNYPTGGILGILFEKPEIAYAIHNIFCNSLLLNIDNLNNYKINDIYINSRISINFILINGSDAKYLKDVSYDDEYLLSSFIPEKLCRPNKIKGDLITAHLSYSFQDKIMLHKDYLLNIYKKIRDLYINFNNSIIKKYNENENLYIPRPHINDGIYKIKNWFTKNHFYIKNIDLDKYLYIDYEEDEITISDSNKNIFEIIDKNNNLIEIKLGIYYLTRYNSIGKFRNEKILFKYTFEEKEREILKEDIDKHNSFYLKFIKHNFYFNLKDDTSINITQNKLTRWIFEKVNYLDEFIYVERIIKNNKIYYKNIKSNEIYTNFYKGWAQENVIW